jgi:hypothetical protein
LADAPGWQVRRLFMRTLLLFLAAAGMAGCASYQTADYDRGAVSAYAQRPAPFIYDRAGYPYGYYATPFFYPPTFARPFAGRPHRVHPGAPAGQRPPPGKGSVLANAVRPPHANNQ